ncbi:DnaJ family domain-containing protein [Leifsonia poae]|uniref:DnaJ family domain-containing protein n=1 Tax=Leifsonia poae TaxID=110933 RepID=UPI001CC197DD|nr:DUF1992 domain-containing protein [Leifsonia poae]
MADGTGRSDSKVNAARYRVDRLANETEAAGEAPESADASAGASADEGSGAAGRSTVEARAQFVETSIQQAIRRGEFDNLPGAGKPLTNLQQTYDPDWWIRQKIERERLTGLGPPALTLRTENAGLDARIAATTTEHAVRVLLEEFNARVVEARRQLQGGPPVVTPTRDVDEELARWRETRLARQREREAERERDEAERAALTRRERRRRARRAGRT